MPQALSRAARAMLLAVVVIAAVSGCTAEPMPTPTTATATPTGDGILRIGTLFPAKGELAIFSAGQVAGVNAAVREINAAGGVLGTPVEVVSRNVGDDQSGAAGPSFDDLVSQGVDVVVGPSSSALVEELLPAAAAAAVPIISPSATSAELTNADAAGWFFRTVSTDADQGSALAGLLAAGGASRVALVGTGGAPGFSEALDSELSGRDAELVAELPGDGDASVAVAQLALSSPDAVVLATSDGGETTVALIVALAAADYVGDKLWLVGSTAASYRDALPDGALAGVRGIVTGFPSDEALRVRFLLEDPGARSFRYAAEAYDATILAALAATLADDDGGASIRRMLLAASAGGIPCSSYGECLDVLSTEDDIDYRGVSGTADLDRNGDVVEPGLATYEFSPENALLMAEWVLN